MSLELNSVDPAVYDLPTLAQLKWSVSPKNTPGDIVNEASIGDSLLRSKFKDRQRLFYVEDSSGSYPEQMAAVVARVSPTINDLDGKPVGMLGFFDAIEDFAPAKQVLDAAVGWLRERGCQSIIGPIDGDTWHSYRFNIGPFDDAPFLLETTNPEYYSEFFSSYGFEVLDTYHSLRIENIEAIMPTMEPAFKTARENGYRFRPLNLRSFTQELRVIYELSCGGFCDNFLYDEIDWDEFLSLYKKARSLIHPELVWIAEDTRGKPVGFLFCLIDYFRAVMAMKGNTNLIAKLKFLWHRSVADAVNFKSIAVLPDHRQSKLGGALMYLGYRESLKLGFTKANLCLIRDGNPSSRLDGGNSRLLRRYELFQLPGSKLIAEQAS